jgi:hypothetical protein
VIHRSRILATILALGAALLPQSESHAFEENVRHGYVSCLACHTSPSGGDLLNSYGRSLSQELMSTWKIRSSPKEGESAPEKWRWGGDVRHIQTYFENDSRKEGREFVMQSNLELGFQHRQTWWVAAFGPRAGPPSTARRGEWIFERFYALWSAAENMAIRVGRMRTTYGLADPNHTRLTKSLLGFGSLSESLQIEAVQLTESGETWLSAGLGQLDEPFANSSERRLVFQDVRYAGEKARWGWQVLLGEEASRRRKLGGIHGIWTMGEKSLLKFEMNVQESVSRSAPSDPTRLWVALASVDREFFQGARGYLFVEDSQRDLNDPGTRRSRGGVGFHWLPIPYMDLSLEYQREAFGLNWREATHAAWLLTHLYI